LFIADDFYYWGHTTFDIFRLANLNTTNKTKYQIDIARKWRSSTDKLDKSKSKHLNSFLTLDYCKMSHMEQLNPNLRYCD